MAQAVFLRGHLLRSTKEPNPIAPAMLASGSRMTARGASAGESVWSSPAVKQGEIRQASGELKLTEASFPELDLATALEHWHDQGEYHPKNQQCHHQQHDWLE